MNLPDALQLTLELMKAQRKPTMKQGKPKIFESPITFHAYTIHNQKGQCVMETSIRNLPRIRATLKIKPLWLREVKTKKITKIA